jgi:hypothetical protein
MKLNQTLILDSQLRNFAFYDVDTACLAIQRIIGQTDGGLASICMSGFDWDNESIEARVGQLRSYIRTEYAHAE